jgi:hypothetical protein
MKLYDLIVQRFFPVGYQETLLRLKDTEIPAADGQYGRGYFYEAYSDDLVQKHCAGTETLSATAINAQGLCCWMALDIDCRDTDTARAAANLQAALYFYKNCPYETMLESSNDYGGYHLWIFPPAPMSGADAVAWIHQFVGNTKFEIRPAINAPAGTTPFYFNNSLRLPGLNPKRGTWSKIWDGSQWIDVRQMT